MRVALPVEPPRGIVLRETMISTIPNAVVSAGFAQNRAGDRLENAPEWTGNVAVDYDRPVTDKLHLFANATLNFQSEVNYREFNDPREIQPAFSKADVRLGVGQVDRRWELALLVRNLFEERTSSLIFPTFPVGLGPNDRVHVPDALRSFTIQARVSF
jgi:iron complex outermembrane recepter protein